MIKKERVYYVDLLRSVSCIFVTASHIFAPICAAINQYSLPVWWFYNVFDSLIRPSAPLFVMISGKLILGSSRNDGYFHFLWRRCSRLVPPFFVWSMIYSYNQTKMQGEVFSFVTAVKKFFEGPAEYHLWFMYVLLGIYLLAPFLQHFVRTASPARQVLVVAAWFIFLIVNFVHPALPIPGRLTILAAYTGFFLLGHVLDETSFLRDKTVWLVAAVICVILFDAWATWYLTVQQDGTLDEKFLGGMAPLVALQGALAFMIMRNTGHAYLLTRPHLLKVTSWLSRESYNVYLMHALFIWLFAQGTMGFVLNETTGGSALVGVPLTTTAVLAGCLCLTAVLEKIPFVSRLVVLSANK